MSASGTRLDQELANRGVAPSRSQAETFIKLGHVKVNGLVVSKPAHLVQPSDKVELNASEHYVSRAGLKLASVANELSLDFKDKVVLDVGSSTGGFTDYALQHGAQLVMAVDVGTKQLHPSLQNNPKLELHEQTDIRNFKTEANIDLVLIDVSFISLREVLPSISKLVNKDSWVVAMVKPQFEAGDNLKHKGIIKNEKIRRQILSDFEHWTQKLFIIINKADSQITGEKGNRERFYLLKALPRQPAFEQSSKPL